MKRFKEFLEEDGAAAGVGGAGPANCVGGGAIAGVGINNPTVPNQGEPGVKLPRKKKSPIMFTLPIARKGYNG